MFKGETLCPFREYKDLFGVPRKGAHSIRFLDVALVDYFLTICLAFVLTYLTSIPIELTTIFSFLFGIVCHILFGVSTYTTRYLGITCT
jgi:hypothetical protein